MKIVTREIKIWETDPVGFSSFRDKLMAFCYDHNVAPDDVKIAPFIYTAPCGSLTAMGIRLTVEKEQNSD